MPAASPSASIRVELNSTLVLSGAKAAPPRASQHATFLNRPLRKKHTLTKRKRRKV
jgi:hypothetical protein